MPSHNPGGGGGGGGRMGNPYVLLPLLALFLLACAFVRRQIHRWRADFDEWVAPPAEWLLVTAHPDDESMFFAPLLTRLRSHGASVHLVCLSTGNYDGLGPVRTRELRAAARALGIERVAVLDREALPDHPTRRWAAADVVAALSEAAETLLLDPPRRRQRLHVVTFDAHGVSGHPNHSDTHRGVRAWADAHRDDVALWTLESVSRVRKFASFLDVAFLAAAAAGPPPQAESRPRRVALVPSFAELRASHRAMKLHASQYVWYRRLFVLFSRYTFVNSLVRE